MTEPGTLKDLTKLARERCRDAFMTVGQLIDNDMERSAMLATVALEMIRGAADLVAEGKNIHPDQALVFVFNRLAEHIEGKLGDVCIETDRPARQKRARE
jgi:hypothetical protein